MTKRRREPVADLLHRLAERIEQHAASAERALDELHTDDGSEAWNRLYVIANDTTSIAATLRHEAERRRR